MLLFIEVSGEAVAARLELRKIWSLAFSGCGIEEVMKSEMSFRKFVSYSWAYLCCMHHSKSFM